MQHHNRQYAGSTIVAAALICLSLGGVVISYAMPRPEGWSTAPGLFPLLVSFILLLLSLRVVISSVLSGFSGLRPTSTQRVSRVFGAMLAVGLLYFLLLPNMWFEPAVALFLFFVTVFFWPGAPLLARVLFALLTPLCLVLVFQTLFDFAMPGAGTMIETIVFALN